MSVRYRKIPDWLWNNAAFCALSDYAQLLFLFIITHPMMTMAGAMRHTLAGLGCEKRWPPDLIQQTVQELSRYGFLRVDVDAFVVSVPIFFRLDPPQNENVLKGAAAVILSLPRCPVLTAHVAALSAELDTDPARQTVFESILSDAFPEAFRDGSDTVSEPCRTPDPEQEPEHDKEPEEECGEPVPDSPPSPPLLVNEVSANPDPVFLEYPCKGEAVYQLPESLIVEFEAAFGELIDVRQTLREARPWYVTNPAKRKTPGGMPKSLRSWLQRAVGDAKQAKQSGRAPVRTNGRITGPASGEGVFDAITPGGF